MNLRDIFGNMVLCPECKRLFNLLDETDANEWYNGHDCEGS